MTFKNNIPVAGKAILQYILCYRERIQIRSKNISSPKNKHMKFKIHSNIVSSGRRDIHEPHATINAKTSRQQYRLYDSRKKNIPVPPIKRCLRSDQTQVIWAKLDALIGKDGIDHVLWRDIHGLDSIKAEMQQIRICFPGY